MRIVKDTIPVKGEQPAAVEYKYTRHGPVIYEDRTSQGLRAAGGVDGDRLVAVSRQPADEPGEDVGGVPRRVRVQPDAVGEHDLGRPDRHHRLAVSGIQPLRRNWSGLLPVPGDGRYEWDGYLPITALPHEVNPARGFVATANHYLFPNDYPYPEAMHYTWADPYRASRITEVLGSGRLMSVAEMARLQNDDLSIPARAMVPLLRDVTLNNATSAKAREMLLGWDFVMDKNSVPAGIFGMFQRRLLANVRDVMFRLPRARRSARTSSRPSASSTGSTRPTAISAPTRPPRVTRS